MPLVVLVLFVVSYFIFLSVGYWVVGSGLVYVGSFGEEEGAPHRCGPLGMGLGGK